MAVDAGATGRTLSRRLRPVGIVFACVATSIGLGGTVPARATPTDDQQPASCVFTLSKPFLVSVSGVTMVSATLKSLPCTGDILPNSQNVCVELQGSGAPSQCDLQNGYTMAQVYFAPYRPGATYVSTGTGCGATGAMMLSVCATQGPFSATL
jgi:hypothetical protein